MLKSTLLSLSLILLFQTSYATSQLDLSPGAVKFCGKSQADLNEIAFKADISSKRLANGGLELNIDSKIVQCVQNINSDNHWSPLMNGKANNYFGQIELSRMTLMVFTEDGVVISNTNLKIEDQQTVKISAQQMKNLKGANLLVSAMGFQTFLVHGSVQDFAPIVFGTYLVQGY